ncbi:MAG: hypothetical protein ACRCX8_12890 [Sarcina sp.]
MKIYAFRKNQNDDKNSVILELTKEEFDRLQYKYKSYQILGNYENIKKLKQFDVRKNKFIDLIFKAICKFIKSDAEKYFKSENMSIKVAVAVLDNRTLEAYRKHFEIIFGIFDNNINVNNIEYTDEYCVYSTDII